MRIASIYVFADPFLVPLLYLITVCLQVQNDTDGMLVTGFIMHLRCRAYVCMLLVLLPGHCVCIYRRLICRSLDL